MGAARAVARHTGSVTARAMSRAEAKGCRYDAAPQVAWGRRPVSATQTNRHGNVVARAAALRIIRLIPRERSRPRRYSFADAPEGPAQTNSTG
jgi:hypothetical protein